jgi:hypothetical protein
MLSTLRTLRALKHRDSSGRIGALRLEAAGYPKGIALWSLAIELWFAGELVEARELAETILEQEPTDFWCLAICCDYQARAGNTEATLEYAQRLAAADMPGGLRRSFISSALWLIGFGRGAQKYFGWSDRWANWARDYIGSQSSIANST